MYTPSAPSGRSLSDVQGGETGQTATAGSRFDGGVASWGVLLFVFLVARVCPGFQGLFAP
jgi:hypothetical protein